MKVATLFLVVVLLTAVAALAGDAADDRSLIEQMERDRIAAGVGKDVAAIAAATAEDYLQIDSDGVVLDRAATLARIASSEIQLQSNSLDEIDVRVHGDTALVVGRATRKGTREGKDFSGSIRYSRVYEKRNGRWLVVRFQQTPVASPAAAPATTPEAAAGGQGERDQAAEAANRALVAAFERLWNTHDMQALGGLVTEDVDWVDVNGNHTQGREGIVRGHVRVHAGKFKDSVMTVGSVEVDLLGPDVALLHLTVGVRGDTDEDGTPRQPREGMLTWVTVRDGAVWKIRSNHSTNKTPIH